MRIDEMLAIVRFPPVVLRTNRGYRMEQIPPHRWGRPKGDVLAKMYVGCQAQRERNIRSLKRANGRHIGVNR